MDEQSLRRQHSLPLSFQCCRSGLLAFPHDAAQHGKAQKERRGRRTGKPAGEQPGPGAQSKRLESFVLQLSSQVHMWASSCLEAPEGTARRDFPNKAEPASSVLPSPIIVSDDSLVYI